MRLYVMRHCERNLDNCSFESPLIAKGHYNAKNLFGNMNRKKIDVIYSSPFLRTIQTADFYSKMKNIPINIDYSIAEFVSFQDKHNMYSVNNYIIPDVWRANFNINTDKMLIKNYNVNESNNECIYRIYRFINFLMDKYNDTDKNILIVTHMSIVNIFLALENHNIHHNSFNIDEPYPMGLITEINI